MLNCVALSSTGGQSVPGFPVVSAKVDFGSERLKRRVNDRVRIGRASSRTLGHRMCVLPMAVSVAADPFSEAYVPGFGWYPLEPTLSKEALAQRNKLPLANQIRTRDAPVASTKQPDNPRCYGWMRLLRHDNPFRGRS